MDIFLLRNRCQNYSGPIRPHDVFRGDQGTCQMNKKTGGEYIIPMNSVVVTIITNHL